MAGPIYKLYMYRHTEAWYQLSREEQEALVARVVEAGAKVGEKPVLNAYSAWATDRWLGFGISEYPDIEALQRHAQLLQELNWQRYIESESVLGTRWAAGMISSE